MFEISSLHTAEGLSATRALTQPSPSCMLLTYERKTYERFISQSPGLFDEQAACRGRRAAGKGRGLRVEHTVSGRQELESPRPRQAAPLDELDPPALP